MFLEEAVILDIDGGAGEAAPGDEAVEAERGGCSSQGISDEDEDGDGCRKKLRLSRDQSAVLEDSFKEHTTLNPVLNYALIYSTIKLITSIYIYD